MLVSPVFAIYPWQFNPWAGYQTTTTTTVKPPCVRCSNTYFNCKATFYCDVCQTIVTSKECIRKTIMSPEMRMFGRVVKPELYWCIEWKTTTTTIPEQGCNYNNVVYTYDPTCTQGTTPKAECMP